MADERKPPRKRTPRKRAPAKPRPTKADRAKAAEQVASVTPINRNRPGEPQAAGNRASSPKRVEVHVRRAEVLQLRRMGLTFQQISDTLHERYSELGASYDKREASHDLYAMLDLVTIESAKAYLQEDLALLLAMQRRVWPAALNGDLGAVRVMLDILERRSKYLGLDTPIRHVITGGAGDAGLSIETPGEVYEAALGEVDSLLPHVQLPELLGETEPPETGTA